jgi:hypothetical protein
MEHLSKMLGSAFPSMTSNTQGDLAFRALLFSLMTRKPKPRCRVRGFVEEMGAFLQRPMCMSLEGGANRPRPPNNENSDGFQCEKLSRSRSGGSGFSRRWGQHSVRIWHGLTLGRAAGRLHSLSRLRMRTSHLASGHELKRPLLVGPKHTTPSSVVPPCAPLFEQACGVGRRPKTLHWRPTRALSLKYELRQKPTP